ncbi:hypothetical protein FA13DRAFT_829747 [Coprinellus micaceus]|uniref:Uncharacterized protein n=1 Tax=Coprinellus micaceus TaxID=71717 RepID=A0A4Y7T1N8_COPMI|nr:hypothetical protein FA13DRAFT_829747 [Coprinellus micaceus]
MLSAMNASRAQASTRELATVLKTLNTATTEAESPNQSLQLFFDQCLAKVIERWGDVTKRIVYFIGMYHSGVYAKGELYSFIYMVASVVPDKDDSPYKCQLVSLPSTIDVVIGLLCLEDEQDRKPVAMRMSPGHMCSILDLFVGCASSTTGLTNMAGRLASLDGRNRRKFLGAVSGRLEDISERLQDRANLNAGVSDFYNLLAPFCAMATKGPMISFGLCRVLQKATPILSSLTNEAIQH